MTDFSKISTEDLLKMLDDIDRKQAGNAHQVRDTLGEAAIGATFGWGDELAAALASIPAAAQTSDEWSAPRNRLAQVGGAINPMLGALIASPKLRRDVGNAYQGVLGNITKQRDAFRSENPGKALGAQLAGSLVGGFATAPGMLKATGAALPRLGSFGRNTAVAAEQGALGGSGEAGPENRLLGAGTGLAMGAGAAAGMQKLGGWIGPPLMRLAGKIHSSTAGKHLEDVASWGGQTPGRIRHSMARMGEDAMVADTSEGMEALAQGLIDQNPRLRAVIEPMMKARGRRAHAKVVQDAADALQVEKRLLESADELEAVRREAARPWYKMLEGREMPLTPVLKKILGTDIGQEGLKTAQAVRRNTLDAGEMPALLKLADTGEWEKAGVIPTFDDWNLIKQGLDDLAFKGGKIGQRSVFNEHGKRTAIGYKVLDMRRALVGEMRRLLTDDEGVDIYKKALDAWAGPTAVAEAQQDGLKFLSMPMRDVEKWAREASQSERLGFMQGAMEAIRERIGKAKAGQIRGFNVFEGEGVKEKLRTLLIDHASDGMPRGSGEALQARRAAQQAYAKLMRSVETARTFAERQSTLVGGSQTALRSAAGKMVQGASRRHVASEMYDIGATSLIRRMLQGIEDSLTGADPKMLDDLGEALFTPGQVGKAIDLMNRFGLSQQRQARLIERARRFAVGTGGALGQGVGLSLGSM